MRVSFKRILLLAAAATMLVVWLVTSHYDKLLPMVTLAAFHFNFDENDFKHSDVYIKSKLHHSNYVFSHWKGLLKQDKKNSKQLFDEPNYANIDLLPQKCLAFFNYLNNVDPDFKFKTMDNSYDKSITNKGLFFRIQTNNMIKERENHDRTITKNDNVTINDKFFKRFEQTRQTGVDMADTTTILRVFGRCFLNKPEISDKVLQKSENMDSFNSYTRKFFYFLSGKLPNFEKGDELLLLSGFPIYENNRMTGGHHSFDKKKNNLLEYIQRKANGKGIVISASTRYSKDIIKLIRVLRAMNNDLPIQIVYKGDLNKRSKQYIEAAATADKEVLLSGEMTADDAHIFPTIDLEATATQYGLNFPKQDIMFVNVAPAIDKNHKYWFSGYLNKLLGLIFTSFKEVLLLDADTVPLVPPQTFFDMTPYRKSGTFFFKDRTLRDHNDFIETNYFTQLMPLKNSQSIDAAFGYKAVTDKTLANRYMTGWRHFQEAGVVAIDKHQHFLGVLMTLPLALWQTPVKSSIWGDKEMYWLGLSLAGDENYEFNELAAASIGKVSEESKKFYPQSKANEVCSSHPGHVTTEGKLLWINSGFSYCKKNGYYRDKYFFPYTTYESEKLHSLYNNPLEITHALIPPDLPKLRDPGSSIDTMKEKEFILSWRHRKPDLDEVEDKWTQVPDQNPQKGWVKNPACTSYQYCAYDLMDGYEKDLEGELKVNESGKLFSFSEQDILWMNYLGKVWKTGSIRSVPKSKEQLKQEKQLAEAKQLQEEESKKKEEQRKQEEKEKKEKVEEPLQKSEHVQKAEEQERQLQESISQSNNIEEPLQRERPQKLDVNINELIEGYTQTHNI